jgi:hypothetical protein
VCCHDRRHGGHGHHQRHSIVTIRTRCDKLPPRIVPFLDDEILRPFAIDTVIIQSGLVDIGHL